MEQEKILSGSRGFFFKDLGRSMHYFKGAREHRPPGGLFNVLPIVCGSSVFVFCFLCIALCPFWFCARLGGGGGEGGRGLVALLVLSYRCIVTINFLWLFLTMPWVGLRCVIVVFLNHTHLLFVLGR